MTIALAASSKRRFPVSVLIGSAVASLGASVLVGGWLFGIAELRSVVADYMEMRPDTALALCAIGAAIILSHGDPRSSARQRGAKVCATIAAAIGVLTLIEYAIGVSLGIDNILVPRLGAAFDSSHGRPAEGSALVLTWLALALWTLDLPRVRGLYWSDIFSVGSALLSGFALIGRLYGATSLSNISPFSSMAAHTSAALLTASIAVLTLRGERGMSGFFFSDTLGGTLARRLLLAAIVVPVIFGAILLRAVHANLLDDTSALAICALSMTFVFGVLACALGRRLNRVDRARREFEDEVKNLNASLELRIGERTVALNDMNLRLVAEAEERKEAEHQLRTFIEAAPDGLVFCRDDGRIERVNAQAEAMFGYSRAEMVGQSVDILVPEPARERHATHRARFIEAPQARPMGRGLDLFARRKNGSLFPVDVSLSVAQTSRGRVIVAAVRDVLSRRVLESQLNTKSALLRAMAETAQDAMITVDDEDLIRFVNPAAELLFGYAPGALIGLRSSDILSTSFADLHRRAQADEGRWTSARAPRNAVELEILGANQTPLSIEIVVSQYEADGRRYLAAVIRDITERKRADRRIVELNASLLRRNAELGTVNEELEVFNYTVSHDLRTPLRAIAGFSDILATQHSAQLDDSGKEKLARVRAAAVRMGQLFDDVLRLARIMRAELHARDVDLTALIRELEAELRAAHPNRTVELKVAEGLRARGDLAMLRMALANLLENAWKFTQENPEAKIEVFVNRAPQGDVFTVRDNGAGFDQAYAEKLFKPFRRLHEPGRFPGSGIGLATVHRIIRRHGGKIWADSSVGNGARFNFTLGDDAEIEWDGTHNT